MYVYISYIRCSLRQYLKRNYLRLLDIKHRQMTCPYKLNLEHALGVIINHEMVLS